MNKTFKFLGAIVVCAATAFGSISCGEKKADENATAQTDSTARTAAPGSIVYVDLDVILAKYDMANELSSVVETKVQNIQAEVNRRAKKLENDVIDFQNKIDKGLLTRTNAELQSQKLQQQELEFNNYAAQKEQEIQEEQVVMMNQLGDAIQTFINKYNEQKQYAMILTNSGGSPVLTADAALDITDDVLAGLNEEYIKSKNNK